jgi:hypothetical protein
VLVAGAIRARPRRTVSCLGLLDGDGAQAVEPRGERGVKVLGHVLDDNDPGRVDRELLEEHAQRLRPAVEAPTAITLSVVSMLIGPCGIGMTASAVSFGATWISVAGFGRPGLVMLAA